MRCDIQKLLCERERIGHLAPSLKTGKKLNPNLDYDSGDYDWGPTYLSSARRRQENGSTEYKHLNENLNPLFNFLERSVGRKWDDVFSEISAQIDIRRATGFHVFQHVGWHVEKNVMMIGGEPYRIENSYTYPYTGLYVHPDTGILCRNERVRHIRSADPVDSLHWYGNTWFKKEILKRPAKCGCVHFKVRVPTDEMKSRSRWRNYHDPQVCIHGNPATEETLWYVVSYTFHDPDEVYKVYRLEDYRFLDGSLRPSYDRERYGLSKEHPVHYIYYRDVPDILKEPIMKHKKTANRKELKIIRKALLAA